MKEIVITILVNAVLIFVLAPRIKGIEVKNFGTSLVAAILLATANTFVKPALKWISWPITFLTLGFFLLVINALMILLVSALVKDFRVKGFWPAFWLGILLSLLNLILGLSLQLDA